MSFINVWIHAVWTTKNKEPILTRSALYKICGHIRDNADKNNIHVNFINGVETHVHCLISMKSIHSIAEVLNQIKGESSHWINESGLFKSHFEWQNDYYAASVSPWEVRKIREYIRNQQKHHKTQTLDDENKLLFGK